MTDIYSFGWKPSWYQDRTAIMNKKETSLIKPVVKELQSNHVLT